MKTNFKNEIDQRLSTLDWHGEQAVLDQIRQQSQRPQFVLHGKALILAFVLLFLTCFSAAAHRPAGNGAESGGNRSLPG